MTSVNMVSKNYVPNLNLLDITEENDGLNLTLEGISLGTNRSSEHSISPRRTQSNKHSYWKPETSTFSPTSRNKVSVVELGSLVTPRGNVIFTPSNHEAVCPQRPKKPTFLPALDMARLSQPSPLSGKLGDDENSSNENSPKTPRLAEDAFKEKQNDLRISLGPLTSWNTPRLSKFERSRHWTNEDNLYNNFSHKYSSRKSTPLKQRNITNVPVITPRNTVPEYSSSSDTDDEGKETTRLQFPSEERTLNSKQSNTSILHSQNTGSIFHRRNSPAKSHSRLLSRRQDYKNKKLLRFQVESDHLQGQGHGNKLWEDFPSPRNGPDESPGRMTTLTSGVEDFSQPSTLKSEDRQWQGEKDKNWKDNGTKVERWWHE